MHSFLNLCVARNLWAFQNIRLSVHLLLALAVCKACLTPTTAAEHLLCVWELGRHLPRRPCLAFCTTHCKCLFSLIFNERKERGIWTAAMHKAELFLLEGEGLGEHSSPGWQGRYAGVVAAFSSLLPAPSASCWCCCPCVQPRAAAAAVPVLWLLSLFSCASLGATQGLSCLETLPHWSDFGMDDAHSDSPDEPAEPLGGQQEMH